MSRMLSNSQQVLLTFTNGLVISLKVKSRPVFFRDWQKCVNALYCSGQGFLGNNCKDSSIANANG